MTHICVMSSRKLIRIYMEGLILGVNTLYRLFCFLKLFPMVSKGLSGTKIIDEQMRKLHYVECEGRHRWYYEYLCSKVKLPVLPVAQLAQSVRTKVA